MSEVEKVKKALLKKSQNDSVIQTSELLSSGSTLINIAATGNTRGSYLKGKYYRFVGDSNSGKTWLCMSVLAEAANNPNFDDYELIYDNVEDGALMDIQRYFGTKLKNKLKVNYTELIEEFYSSLEKLFKSGKKFVYILDSMDALRSIADDKKYSKNNSRFESGQDLKGSFGDGKAKINSQNLRRVCSKLRKSGSILIIVSQTRDNLNAIGHADKKTDSGGRALKFYATLQIHTSVEKKIVKKIKDKNREQGVRAKVQLKKNRITGRDRSVSVPIYHSFGLDDVGANIDYLIEEGHWKKANGLVKAKEFDVSHRRDELISYIEEEDLEKELRLVVKKVWNEIEDKAKITRKQRYE
jgi:RecA/RadA recombinase